MRPRVLLVLVSITCVACVPSTERIHSQLRAATRSDAALDCGSVSLSHRAEPSSACAAAALASRKPFFVAFQLQGIDSQIWEGLAFGGDGQAQVVRFDSDPSGGRRFFPRPRLAVAPCASPALPAQLGGPIRCGVGR